MLIKSEAENNALEKAGKSYYLAPGSTCAYCRKSVYFPVVIGNKYNQSHSRYHPDCAVTFAQALFGDLLALLPPPNTQAPPVGPE